MTPQKWRLCPPADISLPPGSDIPPLLAQLLHNRGLIDPAQFEIFLAADYRLSHDPFLLPDMGKAVERVLRALHGGETIAVYGDFDADGITATVVMAEGLKALGAKVETYIPHRVDEGHGLNDAALEHLRRKGSSLVITVDCGISGFPEVEQAKKIGLDIIITDHHPPSYQVPLAIAVVDPKQPDSAYPFPDLAGVGVAFKFVSAMFKAAGKSDGLDRLLDLVAVGTVADLVPLVGENRYLVKRGLEALNRTHRIGLQEMVLCAGLEPGRLTTENISFAVGPRLNAGGRLEHAVIGFDLLTATSVEEAHKIAVILEDLNAERQRLTMQTFLSVKEKLKDTKLPLLMAGDPDYVPGVLGVVGNKMVDEFYRPSIVYQIDGDVIRGSGRSIPEFDLFAALGECRDLFTRFGGHTMAAGFTMPASNLEQLQKKLLEIAATKLDVASLQPTILVDAEIPLHDLGGQTYRLINKLAPFGKSNPSPTFLSRRVKVVNSRLVGSNGKHLKMKLKQDSVVWDAIVFNHSEDQGAVFTPGLMPQAQNGAPGQLQSSNIQLDIVYRLESEFWNGAETLRLNVIDFCTS